MHEGLRSLARKRLGCTALAVALVSFIIVMNTSFCRANRALHCSSLVSRVVSRGGTVAMARGEHYRSDGVRIQHDPTAPGMADKYGGAGATDPEGFDPYADTVGPGIYGGNVQRDPDTGEVIIGRQYQNHNPRPGPVYAGTGYTAMTNALRRGPEAIAPLLDADPALVNEVSTGGATPLHMCGMSDRSQHSTEYIISRGGDIEAEDTYGYRPLHRMASNNLAVGAAALLKAGADKHARASGETPLRIALMSNAMDVARVLQEYGAEW